MQPRDVPPTGGTDSIRQSAPTDRLAQDGTGVPAEAIVLADDLIWSSRIVAGLRALGVQPIVVASLAALERVLDDAAGGSHVLIDLTARAYDGLEAVGLAAGREAVVLCVAQHDDADLRRASIAAGAGRVVPYRTMFERGPETLRRWLLDGAAPAAAEADADPASPDPAPAPTAAGTR